MTVACNEFENGINQEIMSDLVRYLAEGETQAVITTHSPLLLNYLKDEEARQGVYFAYRSAQGELRLRRFFEVIDEPELLDVAGPGEIYVNTDLRELAEKCRRLDSTPEEDNA